MVNWARHTQQALKRCLDQFDFINGIIRLLLGEAQAGRGLQAASQHTRLLTCVKLSLAEMVPRSRRT